MIVAALIVILYLIALLLVFAYALIQLNLTINYIWSKRNHKGNSRVRKNNEYQWPLVTIQLPVYNEMNVMERLLKCISQIDYPYEKLEIQVLDDSTDASFLTTKKYIEQLQGSGLDIQHKTRSDRKNFKAGALKEGLSTAKGAFIAIFDADFLPQKDWLKQTVPYFENDQIGVVQTRWGHVNRNYSLLTKAQAFALDYHFHVEQIGRSSKDHFINFNGTAGIWRKSCILDAGNWQGDTLTEDLDLSYRAQLKGWKIKYLEDVVTPAELPVVISAARSQQFRWNKGGAENFRKNMFSVLRSKHLSMLTKVHAAFHLLNSSVFLAIILIAVLSVPLLFIETAFPQFNFVFDLMGFFILSTLIFMFCYWISYREEHDIHFFSVFEFVGLFFAFFTMAIGLSWNNAWAVFEGHIGKKSAFIRTPKFNIQSKSDHWKNKKYSVPAQISFQFIAEGLFMFYFAFALFATFYWSSISMTIVLFGFHVLLFLGFGYVFFQSIFNRS